MTNISWVVCGYGWKVLILWNLMFFSPHLSIQYNSDKHLRKLLSQPHKFFLKFPYKVKVWIACKILRCKGINRDQ